MPGRAAAAFPDGAMTAEHPPGPALGTWAAASLESGCWPPELELVLLDVLAMHKPAGAWQGQQQRGPCLLHKEASPTPLHHRHVTPASLPILPPLLLLIDLNWLHTGVHAHFRMAAIYATLQKLVPDITSAGIWEHLRTLYDFSELVRRCCANRFSGALSLP